MPSQIAAPLAHSSSEGCQASRATIAIAPQLRGSGVAVCHDEFVVSVLVRVVIIRIITLGVLLIVRLRLRPLRSCHVPREAAV